MAFKAKAFKVTVTYGDESIKEWFAGWIKRYAKETLDIDVTVKIVDRYEADRKAT